jgi:hypothetical protein
MPQVREKFDLAVSNNGSDVSGGHAAVCHCEPLNLCHPEPAAAGEGPPEMMKTETLPVRLFGPCRSSLWWKSLAGGIYLLCIAGGPSANIRPQDDRDEELGIPPRSFLAFSISHWI